MVVVDLLVNVLSVLMIEVVWVVDVVEERRVAARRAAGVSEIEG